MMNREWFRAAGFGLMVHWGLYSILGGEWKNQRMDYIGEWIQSRFEIPGIEYGKLAKIFNPIYFDAEEWVSIAKAAGMKYLVVTSKHHDGFCLFDSAYDDYNIVRGTPFRRDVIGELADACAKYGMKLGLYYSQELDWHEPNGGGYNAGKTNHGMSWTNCWDYPDNEHKDFEQCFRAKTLPQVRELLTKYGDICLMWFDTPHVITHEQSRELFDLVKSLQPDCLVNSRIGNGLGDYRSCGDNQITFDKTKMGPPRGSSARDAERFMQTDLYECPATLNKTWGYKTFDQEWKDAEQVIEIRKSLNERGINYLLNVGPDPLGRFPAAAVDILRRVGDISRSE